MRGSMIGIGLLGAAGVAYAYLLSDTYGWVPALVLAALLALSWYGVFMREAREPDSAFSKPIEAPEQTSIDIAEELLDLLHSARARASRVLEEEGRLKPFVLYEDAEGSVRVRQVESAVPTLTLARGREVARAIDESAPRVVLAVPATARFGRRVTRAIYYEAAERGFTARTFAFLQRVRGRSLVAPAHAEGYPYYIGDSEHTLRFASPYRVGPVPAVATDRQAH